MGEVVGEEDGDTVDGKVDDAVVGAGSWALSLVTAIPWAARWTAMPCVEHNFLMQPDNHQLGDPGDELRREEQRQPDDKQSYEQQYPGDEQQYPGNEQPCYKQQQPDDEHPYEYEGQRCLAWSTVF